MFLFDMTQTVGTWGPLVVTDMHSSKRTIAVVGLAWAAIKHGCHMPSSVVTDNRGSQ